MEGLDQFFTDFIQLFLQIEYLDETIFAFPQQSLCWLRRGVHSIINIPALAYLLCWKEKKNLQAATTGKHQP